MADRARRQGAAAAHHEDAVVVVGVRQRDNGLGQGADERGRVAGVERVADEHAAGVQARDGGAQGRTPAVRFAHAGAVGLVDVVDDHVERRSAVALGDVALRVGADDAGAERVERECAPRDREHLGVEVDRDDVGFWQERPHDASRCRRRPRAGARAARGRPAPVAPARRAGPNCRR
jgi:hypothetical protein